MLLHTQDMIWLGETKTFHVDASDCGIPPGKFPGYNASVVSQKTGDVKKFSYVREETICGQVTGWKYEICDPLIECFLVIYND